MRLNMNLVKEADRAGFHSIWTAEAYGSDAVSLRRGCWRRRKIHVGTGIMQMPARSPAMTAMTATTLDQLSGGRFLLGLGVSGPQVVEGWHGVQYGKPLTRTREYIEILRAIWAREKPLEHQGTHYHIPNRDPGSTGFGKPLKSILHGRQIPIYIAAIGPKSVEQTAEIADGWLPIFYSPHAPKVYQARSTPASPKGPERQSFDIAAGPTVIIGDDVNACPTSSNRCWRCTSAAWGARQELLQRPRLPLRLRGRSQKIQDLYLDGKKEEATAAVPTPSPTSPLVVKRHPRALARGRKRR
jgi:F420-dependent oxidoreductase-like protein